MSFFLSWESPLESSSPCLRSEGKRIDDGCEIGHTRAVKLGSGSVVKISVSKNDVDARKPKELKVQNY